MTFHVRVHGSDATCPPERACRQNRAGHRARRLELAARCGVEEVALLLCNGELPGRAELADFKLEERSHRAIDDHVRLTIDDLSLTTHPMHVCRTAVSVIGANDPDAESNAPEDNQRKARHLFARLPAIVACDQRRRHGLPLAELEVADAFRLSLVLYAEHSFNASTFAARVITSTLSDLYSAGRPTSWNRWPRTPSSGRSRCTSARRSVMSRSPRMCPTSSAPCASTGSPAR